MLKKFLCALFVFFSFSLPVCAEEYIFETSCPFPVFYSSSIKVVNEKHNVYTADNIEDILPLIEEGIVDYCEPMSYSELFEYEPNDKFYNEQTNLTQVLTQFAWNKNIFGESVKIAVIDSGIYTGASDFDFNNIYKVADYTSTADNDIDFCEDEIGHGTKVTGIIAARHNTRGIAGIAPEVEIYIYKCFYLNESGKQTARNSDILNAIYDAIDEQEVDIINLSSGTTNPNVFKAVSDYAEEKGVLIVSAVGNQGSLSGDTIYYPASYPNVIGVGSVKADGHRASHSQRNDYVDIMAPGENIYSTAGKSSATGYDTGTGTSFATPHVVAALALAKSVNPNLTYDELTTALYTTCNPMTDRYSGHGSLNVQALLTYVHAMSNKDKHVYSSANNQRFMFYVPSDDYVSYFARYKDDIMLDAQENGINAFNDEIVKHFIWKKGSLIPYSGKIEKIPY